MKTFKPISTKSRIEVVDALRGFALLGVLLANVPYGSDQLIISNFDMPQTVLNFLLDFLISKKFITIFSILFGFGFYIQMTRAKKKKVNFKKYFLKRMILLFIIGSIHSFMLWNGDIIMAYAFGGIFLLLVRNWSTKKLVILAILFNVLLTGIIYIGNSAFGWQIYDYDYGLNNIYPITESFLEYIKINFIMAPWVNFFKDMPITLVYTFGNMLIGLILGKIDFFHLPDRLKKLNNWLIVLGITVGLTASYFFHQLMIGAIELDIPLLWVPFALIIGMLLQSLCYIVIFIKLYQIGFFKRIMEWFKFVGKTALSNYIFQSVFYLIVFFHCTNALQLFGKISQAETYILALFFFVFQSLLSYLWLKRKGQGPLEYLWKKMSYSNKKSVK